MFTKVLHRLLSDTLKREDDLNPTEQTCNTIGFRQFIVAYDTYLHKMVILTKYNLVENLGP